MTTSRYERIIIWIASAALGAFAVACILWTPYDQSKLLRPIPSNAVLISSHYNLGPRLEYMATNIFLKAFFDSNETALKSLHKNRYAARVLASHAIVAYVPDFNQFTTRGHAKRLASAWLSNPALVISSWVGGWTAVLRWALWIHAPKDILPLGDCNGHRLWTYKKPIPLFGKACFLSFAIDEGIFIGCLSQDRNGIVYLLRNYDGRKDSILNVPQCRFAEKISVSDQVWLRIDLPNTAQNKSFFAFCSLDALENDYLSATIRFDSDIPLNDFAGLNQNLAEIGKMYACSPSIAALFPSDMVADGLNSWLSPTWSKAVKPILTPSSGINNVCLLTVFTGDYGGQFGKEPFRITVPTVLLALSGCRQEQTKAAVLELLDLINQKYRLGLILNSALPPAGQCPVYAIESTSRAPLNSLSVEDQTAFAFYNDWFLLAGNSAGLRKLILNFQSQAVSADDGNKNWLNQAACRPAKAFIWIDPGAGGQALRFALTASIIMLDADGLNQPKQNTIKILKAARSWLEGINSLKNCAAWMESENGKPVVRLEIGHKHSDNKR